MPRSRGGRPAPARAQVPFPSLSSSSPPRSAAPQQQQRPMSTTANTAQGQAPAQAQGPGLFGQMASTAAGVAVGSSIGHAIGGWFGGGSSSSAPEEAYQQPDSATNNAYAQPMDAGLYNSNATSHQQSQAAGPCAADIKNFTSCMDQNQGSMTICGWYLEQLKACQQAAKQY